MTINLKALETQLGNFQQQLFALQREARNAVEFGPLLRLEARAFALFHAIGECHVDAWRAYEQTGHYTWHNLMTYASDLENGALALHDKLEALTEAMA